MSKKIKPYIVIAQQEWVLDLGSNARNIALELSKTRPVLYVNPATDIKSIFVQIKLAHGKKRLALALGLGNNTIKITNNLWVHTPSTINYSINWLKNISVFNFFSRLNAKGFFKSLKKSIAFLSWKIEDCTIFNDSQMFTGQYIKDFIKCSKNFYYIRDNLVSQPYFKFHGSRIEPLTIAFADAIFTNSAYLSDYARQYNLTSIDIGQGCELDIFNAEKEFLIPDDIYIIPHPRIGYIGALTSMRLDLDLLEKITEEKKEWNWIFIGPEDKEFKQSKLHNKANVYFLGSKKTEEVPMYIQQLDVCINPQLINDLTEGNYPRKIDEYLAMGKPVVATETPAMTFFLPHVWLAIGVSAYCNAIENALQIKQTKEISAKINFAKSHTWKACINKIEANNEN